MQLREFVFLAGILSGITLDASAQRYPEKPVRLVTGAPAGGADLVARLVAAGLSENWAQQVIVDNRGNGAIPGQILARAQPDGYTLLVNGSNIWILPFLQNHVPYDPVKDFSTITLTASFPNILVVHPAVAAKSVRELIALAKAKPGSLNYASGPTGSANHLAAERFKAMAGVDIVRVSYKGSAAALTDLIAGQVQVMFPNAGAVTPYIKSGRLRVMAIASAQPSTLAPEIPTVAASGLPGYESATTVGMFAPARTRASLIARLHQDIVRLIYTPEVKEKFFNAGAEVVGNTPQQFAATVKSDMARLGKVIRDAAIRGE